jgi:REP element-mobilizing transposase RayT
MDSTSRSYERQRVDKRHLPRLAPEFYRGLAFIHWTLTTEHRATGWLNPEFHYTWQLTLLHTCARYAIACPAYVLMPDHAHLIWLGLDEEGSDQRVAIEFLRKHLRPSLAPAEWQQQPHDHVLREAEREHGAFQAVAHYVFENPVRAGLAERWQDYPLNGCCIAGYPEFTVRAPDYWARVWRCYNYLIEKRC